MGQVGTGHTQLDSHLNLLNAQAVGGIALDGGGGGGGEWAGVLLELLQGKVRLATRQLATAASSMWLGEGPADSPKGGGSSTISRAMPGAKSIKNW